MNQPELGAMTQGQTQIEPEEQWQEGQRLKLVYKKIVAAIEALVENQPRFREEIVEARRRMWEEEQHRVPDLDEAANAKLWLDAIGQNMRTYEQNAQQVRQLRRLEETPYFGRMDWQENGLDVEPLYIGVASFMDPDQFAPLVYDWRAPISSVFYDHELGAASYQCPEGTITGQVTLKRQYKIERDVLLYMFDCSLQIEDELLQQMLARRTSPSMRNIVTTIQREQNAIIRDDTHRVLLVLGVAGSGKTSIALHRAAWFLYRYQDRKYISKNILIVSPNEVFGDYIAQVLPELGEEAVQQYTLHALVAELLGRTVETPQQQLETLWLHNQSAGTTDRRSVMTWKASSTCLDALGQYCDKLIQRWTQHFAVIRLVHDDTLIYGRDELVSMFETEFVSALPVTRLQRIRQILHYRLRTHRRKRFDQLVAELDVKRDTFKEERAHCWWQAFAEFKQVRDQIQAMTAYDPMEAYAGFYQDGLQLDTQWTDLVQRMTLPGLKNAQRDPKYPLRWEDGPLLAWMRIRLEGGTHLPFHADEIFQLIVDEVQDYSAVQLAVLRTLFPHVGITALGDLRQTIAPRDVSALRELGSEGLVLQLNHCYRSTQPIVDFTRALLAPGDGEEIVAVRRDDVLPKVGTWATPESLWNKIKVLQEEEWGLIGVICQTAQRSREIHQQLKPLAGDAPLHMLTDEERLSSGISVLPLYLAKGLEFDAVIVLDADSDHYGREEERLMLYTACTRALHRLQVLWHKTAQPSRFVKDMPEELYRNGK